MDTEQMDWNDKNRGRPASAASSDEDRVGLHLKPREAPLRRTWTAGAWFWAIIFAGVIFGPLGVFAWRWALGL